MRAIRREENGGKLNTKGEESKVKTTPGEGRQGRAAARREGKRLKERPNRCVEVCMVQ